MVASGEAEVPQSGRPPRGRNRGCPRLPATRGTPEGRAVGSAHRGNNAWRWPNVQTPKTLRRHQQSLRRFTRVQDPVHRSADVKLCLRAHRRDRHAARQRLDPRVPPARDPDLGDALRLHEGAQLPPARATRTLRLPSTVRRLGPCFRLRAPPDFGARHRRHAAWGPAPACARDPDYCGFGTVMSAAGCFRRRPRNPDQPPIHVHSDPSVLNARHRRACYTCYICGARRLSTCRRRPQRGTPRSLRAPSAPLRSDRVRSSPRKTLRLAVGCASATGRAS